MPFHSSLSFLKGGVPPKAKPAVVVPAPDIEYLAVLISAISDHEVPLYCSTSFATVNPPGSLPPPTANAAV